ncbi:MAG: DUF5677 domain-containing protein [Candidatus Acidiferrales bacterium]
MFPLRPDLDAIHSDAIEFASVIQNKIASSGGCKNLASEALNILARSAILTHRSVRTLCEEGWTPVTSVLNRTLLDLFANCVAVANKPADADYMGFKYVTHFYRKWLTDPHITNPERTNVNAIIDELVGRLQHPDQIRARQLLLETEPTVYWYQPDFGSPKKVLALATHSTYDMFKFLSGPTHGGYAMKILFNDDPNSEDIEPQEHARNVPKAIAASTRFLLEVCYIRDHFDNQGKNEPIYQTLVARLAALI